MSTRDVVIAIIGKDLASPALLKAAASAETAAGRMGKAGATMQKTGVAMSKAVTLPVVAAAAVSVDQAMKFQKSMTLLQTAGGETAAKMTVISKGIKDVAVATGTSLTDLSEGMYTIAKAGSTKWTAVEQLQVLKAAAQGAKAENVDLGTATNALTSILMSYHLGADKAVAVQNELVIGAGKAKTTMQEYAASLATVVPVASAAGISFAQIGGAIATLTQHGTSAQEATQELAFTIRALQAPNSVASKAMQQLGLNVTDVQKNLGKRGLTGTIDLVTDAIKKKMGPSGLVVVDAFKKSQSATADLGIELSKMPKRLADISTQFETGKMSYKDYYTSVKGLGGAAFEMGKGFISTMAQAKGFNALLAAGNPAATTFAAYLTKVMGGASGLNTALQLGGENMTYFKSATAAIGKAAQGAGGDVLGWAKTQDTLAVKMDKAKANLQVFAVELGTALIPAISKVVGWLTNTVTWFDNLSTSWKKTIGVSVLVIAALGPLLAIVGRVTKAFAFMWAAGMLPTRFIGGMMQAEMSMTSMSTKSYAAGNKVGTMFSNMGTKASAFVKGLGALAIGGVAGQIGGSSGGGWLTSIMLGTGGGWLVGGPVGAAIGGVSAAISKGVGLWNDHRKAAEAAAAAEKAMVDTLTSAINSDNGALGTNLKLQITKTLQDKGILDEAQKLGISLGSVVSAAMGNKSAMMSAISGPLAAIQAQIQQKLGYLQSRPGGKNITAAQAAPVNAQLNALYAQEVEYKKLQSQISALSGDTTKATANYNQFEHVMNDTRVSTGKFASQLAAMNSKQSLAVDMNGQLATSLSKYTVEGQHNRQTLMDLSKAAQTEAESTIQSALAHGKTLPQALQIANKQLQGNITKIEASATAAGLNSTQVAALVKVYGKIPKSVLTTLQKKGVLPADIQKIINAYNKIPKTLSTVVTVTTKQNLGSTYKSQVPGYHSATGGTVPGSGSGGVDSVPAMLAPGEEVINAKQATKHRSLLKAINAGMRGFATGGTVGITKSTIGGKPVWVYKGKDYVSERAAHNAEVSAQQAAQKKHASYIKAINGTDTKGLYHSLTGTPYEISSAVGKLMGDSSAAGGSKSLAGKLKKDNTALAIMASQRIIIASKLATANQNLATAQSNYNNEKSSTAATTKSGFNVLTAGQDAFGNTTASGIVANLMSVVAAARTFAKNLLTLKKNGIPAVILAQLAEAGPVAGGAAATALLSASKSQVAALKSGESSLNAVSNQIGGVSADALFGAGVASAKGIVAGLKSQQAAVNKAMTDMANSMIKQIKKDLGIKSPSTVFHKLGQHVSKGMENGVKSGHHGVRAAISGMYSRAEFPSHGRSGGVYIEAINNFEQSDPTGTAHQVVRHIVHAGI